MLTRILYVEDNDDIREINSELLVKTGYNVTPVANGLEALKLFQKIKFDLIITDIFMPVMDGNKLIEELARYRELPPILALSYNYFDILPNPIITVAGLKPIKLADFRLLIYKALHERRLDSSGNEFAS